MIDADVLIVAEPKFSGGSATALLADARAFLNGGASIALLLVNSDFFSGAEDTTNPDILALADQPGVTLVHDGSAVRCDTAFFHHPLTFYFDVREKVSVQAQTGILVAHHPAFRGDGSLEYNPVTVSHKIRKSFGVVPLWAPVSGVVRSQLACFTPFLKLTEDDWNNVFDVDQWVSKRQIFSDKAPCVGRHSRPDVLKWPGDIEPFIAPLSPGPDWNTRIMGMPPDIPFKDDPRTGRWDVLAFNAEPVDEFLDSLDAFSYFYHDRWVEAFGRTIIEAMLMERPCVLDERLKPNFGSLALYCAPQDAADCLIKIWNDPKTARQRAAQVRETIAFSYGQDQVFARWKALRPAVSSPTAAYGRLTTIRKSIGLLRRQKALR